METNDADEVPDQMAGTGKHCQGPECSADQNVHYPGPLGGRLVMWLEGIERQDKLINATRGIKSSHRIAPSTP
jgi:hypothetical protein